MSETDQRIMPEDSFPVTLQKMRDLYSDQIPQEILNGRMPPDKKKAKVRKNWFHGLTNELENAMNGIDGEISDPAIRKEVTRFLRHYTSKKFHQQKLTTAEDITRANAIINLILEEK